ncbi:MAG: hypothetical protein ABI411_08515 [Tahibacter sp.]
MPSELKSISPDGRYLIHIDAWEARNSLWVESPRLSEAKSGAILLRFHSTMWSLDRARWLSEHEVELTLRKYPGNHAPADLVAVVDCVHGSASVAESAAVALDQLEALLERQLTWK